MIDRAMVNALDSNPPERTVPPREGSSDAGKSTAILGTSIFLAAVVLLVFGRTVLYEFTNYDDDQYVFNNPAVASGLSFPGVLWAFTHAHAANWHPLTWLSHMLDCELWGLNAGGHHLTSVILHAVNTALLFILLWRLTGARWRSAFVAALFAVHPLHVESVAWVSERKDVLSTCFGLLALLQYVQYVRRKSANDSAVKNSASHYYRLAILFFGLALMSKPMLVTLPFVMLLLDWWPLERISTAGTGPTTDSAARSLLRLLREKIPFFALSAVSSALTFLVQSRSGAAPSLASLSLWLRVENAFVAYARYLCKMFWPMNLAIPYPHPGVWGSEKVIVSIILVLGIGLVALKLARPAPYLATGWFWFCGMLVPVIGLVQVGNQSMADRYTYLPMVGLFIMGTWAGAAALERIGWNRTVGPAIAIMVVVCCAALSWKQVAYWKNTETLFQHSIEVTSNNAMAHYNLGSWYYSNGRVDDAVFHYRKAVEIRPGYDDALNNLGVALAVKGEIDEGIRSIREAIRRRPGKADAYYNLGNVLLLQHKLEEAAQCYSEALRLKPDYVEAHNNLANVLASEGQKEQAAFHYREVLRLKPDHEGARRQLRALGF